MQLLLAGASRPALGDRDQRHLAQQLQFFQRLGGRAQLPFAAVDENQVRAFAVFLQHTTVSAQQGLAQRRGVVAGRDVGDVVPAVVGLHRPLRIEGHACADRALAHGVTDVETFNARRRFVQRQQVHQRMALRVDLVALFEMRAQVVGGVDARRVEPSGAVRATVIFNCDAFIFRRQRRLQ